MITALYKHSIAQFSFDDNSYIIDITTKHTTYTFNFDNVKDYNDLLDELYDDTISIIEIESEHTDNDIIYRIYPN